MKEESNPPAMGLSFWHDLRRCWRPLLVFFVAIKLLELWLVTPITALAISTLVSRTGQVAISNQDILSFFATPAGLAGLSALGLGALVLFLIEQTGILLVLNPPPEPEQPDWLGPWPAIGGLLGRILLLGFLIYLALILLLIPLAGLLFLTYQYLLTQYDIYFYLKERPTSFWLAAFLGLLFLVVFGLVFLAGLLRWFLALPTLVFEGRSVLSALSLSSKRTQGARWWICGVLAGWLATCALIVTGGEGGFRFVANLVLQNAGERPFARIIVLLLARSALLSLISFMALVSLGLVMRRVYFHRLQQTGQSWHPVPLDSVHPGRNFWRQRLAELVVFLAIMTPVVLWYRLPRYMPADHSVAITAHRGHARAAPENTLSAIRKAIASGADYAEIDVHQTRDGVVVLLHDRDLRRVAGVSSRLDDLTLKEVRRLDVGSWFGPAFAGEKVPTLEEVMELARGKIKLNIELKFFGDDLELAPEVARLVHKNRFARECVVTSFSLEALRLARQEDPNLRTGLIIAKSLGDPSQLEVDVLSVRADFLSRSLLRNAQEQGKEVHVWTVNDPNQIWIMIKRGVDNVITSDPDLGIQIRDEWLKMSDGERFLIACRHLLGLSP